MKNKGIVLKSFAWQPSPTFTHSCIIIPFPLDTISNGTHGMKVISESGAGQAIFSETGSKNDERIITLFVIHFHILCKWITNDYELRINTNIRI